jgi:DNA-binding NtrC family response regulator
MALINDDSEKFDVIVTDFAMPGISGLELVKWARGVRADWPAVIITGYADTAVIAERPADVPLITKPFEIGQLVSEIERVRGVDSGDGREGC